MKRIQSRSYYKLLILLAGLVWVQMGRAEYYSAAQNRLGHYLGISIGGGECNNVGKTDLPVKHRLGWTAELAVRYEMQYRNWAWGIGVEGACQTLNNSTAFTDNLNRIDMDGDAFNYQYVYTAFAEKDLLANIAIPIYVGKQFNHVYTLLCLAVEIPIWARYTTNTNMYTQGIYEWSISPVVSDATNDFSPLGFYPASDYTYTDNYQERLRLTPFLEVGYEFLNTNRVNMRAGAYASYAIPIMAPKTVALADYTAIDCNPNTQNQQNMEQNIRWNPIGISDKYLATEYKLEVGVKLTVLFNILGKGECMCLE